MSQIDISSPYGSSDSLSNGFNTTLNEASEPLVPDYDGPTEQKSSKTAPGLTII